MVWSEEREEGNDMIILKTKHRNSNLKLESIAAGNSQMFTAQMSPASRSIYPSAYNSIFRAEEMVQEANCLLHTTLTN